MVARELYEESMLSPTQVACREYFYMFSGLSEFPPLNRPTPSVHSWVSGL